MKKMKLSNQLSILFLVIILMLLGYQGYVSNRVIPDEVKLWDRQSPKEIYSVVKELKTYKRMKASPFSSVVIDDNISVTLLKGEVFDVFYSNYFNIKVEQDGDKLKIKSRSDAPFLDNSRSPVYVFMPEDPDTVTVYGDRNASCKIFGFLGTNTWLDLRSSSAYISTDMPYVNIRQSKNTVNLTPETLDSTAVIDRMNVNAQVEDQSRFKIDRSRKLNTLNATLHLNNGFFNLDITPQTQLGTIKINGTVKGHDPEFDFTDSRINFNYCDSLIMNLKNVGGMYRISCSDTIKANHKSIELKSVSLTVEGE